MSKSAILSAVKSIFIASAATKSLETLRTGLISGFSIALLSLMIMMSGALNDTDAKLNSMILQMRLQSKEYDKSKSEEHPRVWIVKKDQATSELLEKNPDRDEFASMFRFLGGYQIAKRRSEDKGRGLRVLCIEIGTFSGITDLVFKTGYDEWGSFLDASEPASATQNKIFDQTQWHSTGRRIRDFFKNNPDKHGFSSLIKVESVFWNPMQKNFFTSLSGSTLDRTASYQKFFLLPTLAINWGDPELKEYIQKSLETPDKNTPEPVDAEDQTDYKLFGGCAAGGIGDHANAGFNEQMGADALYLLNCWKNLLENIGRLSPRFSIDLYDRPGNVLSISLHADIEHPPSEFLIEPAAIIGFDFVLQGDKRPETDAMLVNAIASSQSKIILAAHTLREEVAITPSETDTASDAARLAKAGTKVVTRTIMPHAKFVTGNAETAMIDMGVGSKSFVTAAPVFILNEQTRQLLPSFSLKIAMLELDRQFPDKKPSYSDEMNRALVDIYDSVASGTFGGPLVIHDRRIPVTSSGMMLIDFVGSTVRGSKGAAIGSVSFYECFDRKTLKKFSRAMPEKTALQPDNAHARILGAGAGSKNKSGQILLAGPFEASDFDFFPTPLDLQTIYRVQKEPLMGIEIHANAIINILDQLYISHPNSRHTAIALFLSCLLLGFLLDILTPVAGAFLTFAFMISAFWHSYNSYHIARQMFNCSALLISYPAIWAIATLTNYVRQRVRAQKTKDMFSRFVAADVVQYMLDNPELVKPGGDKVELSIFFSDVAGFTSISEALTPEELVVLLNEYLGAMTDLLFEYGGTLDKFIGDAVMAFWNFPRKQDDHAVRACLCAIAMQRKINELQIGWQARGLPRVSARAGINSANVVVGYMGSLKAQMNFTCMGDGVNLASRLEGANKEYGTMLMVSDATYQKAKHAVTGRFLDFLAVKGKKEPVKVFELVSEIGKEPPGWSELVAMYDRAIQLHLDRKWDEAIATFEEILVRWPDDGPSRTYITRCNEYKQTPPPEGWDGRYILTHK
ncbi:MAG: hypothetical protein CVV41_00620 [Candidatus Riflebacteria bacterium HGW-Riflebacteria-1]|jgi:adenylate cyclase|nr:MAG: hypothetical protein CVV41_00620 [Candidatus Riflebacteria bacterium HGW-Riflebacteria-1]